MKIKSAYNGLSKEVKASIWFMFCNLIQKGISFITVPIFTRMMTSAEYGEYMVFLSWESILSILVTLNLCYEVFNNGMVKFSKDKDGYASSMVGLTFFTTLSACGIYYVFNEPILDIMRMSNRNITFMFLDMFFLAISGLWTVRKRYEFDYRKLTVLTLINIVLNPTLGILFVSSFENKVEARILSSVISNAIFFSVTFYELLKKSMKIINLQYWKYALRINLPLLPHYFSMVFLNNIDRIIINQYYGDKYTAFYSVAYNVAMIMQIIIASINSSFNPWLYRQLENKNYTIICKKAKVLLSIVALFSLLPSAFAPEILQILGSSGYVEAKGIVPLLTNCVFLIFVYTLFSNVELFHEKSRYIMFGSLAASAVNFITNIIFVPQFGYFAAAYTTLISYILLAVFHYIMMMKVQKENNIKEKIFDVLYIIKIEMILLLTAVILELVYTYFWLRIGIVAGVIVLFLYIMKRH